VNRLYSLSVCMVSSSTWPTWISWHPQNISDQIVAMHGA
jgi:hypothetical protein